MISRDDAKRMLGERIRQIRVMRGLSQDDVARLAGYNSRSTINKIEKGLRDVPQSKISALAHALGVTEADLLDINAEEASQVDIAKVALFGGDEQVTDEMWNEVKAFAEFVKQKYKR